MENRSGQSQSPRRRKKTPPLAAERTEFMKLEYQALMGKVSAMREDLFKTETVYPFAMFAIYAWLLTHSAPVPWLWSLGMTLPFVIAVLGVVRIRGRLRLLTWLETYARRIENEFYGGQQPGGWEHLYLERRPMRGVAKFRSAVGIVLLVGSLLLSLWAWGAAKDLWKDGSVSASDLSAAGRPS